MHLLDLPEELIEYIFSDSFGFTPRVEWHRPPHSSVLALILSCRALLRICLPLMYRRIHLRDERRVRLLSRCLNASPILSSYIRALRIDGAFTNVATILHHSASTLVCLDFTLTVTLECACLEKALLAVQNVRHLILRKHPTVYMTYRVAGVLRLFAESVGRWPQLETAAVFFRLSDDKGPQTQLAQCLAVCPNLHSFTTILPSVWNSLIHTISQNPRLRKITLLQGTSSPHYGAEAGVASTSLYITEARSHSRLYELIRSGTMIHRSCPYTQTTPGVRHYVPVSEPFGDYFYPRSTIHV